MWNLREQWESHAMGVRFSMKSVHRASHGHWEYNCKNEVLLNFCNCPKCLGQLDGHINILKPTPVSIV